MRALRRAVAILGASAFGAALVLLSPACAAFGTSGETRDGSPTAFDGGAMETPDGAGPVPHADAGVSGGREYDPSTDFATAQNACFDGEDNDGDGVMDCDDRSCQANVPSCCVGASSEVCCAAATEVALPFDGCGGALSSCDAVTDAGYDVFGASGPRAELVGGDASTEVFLPGGVADDGGVLFPGELDPRRGTIRLAATIASSTEPPPDGTVDALAFGLVDAAVDPSSLARVFPVVAVVVSRNRQEVSLVVAGEAVERWMLLDDQPHGYELSLAPDGSVTLASDGLAQADEARARVVVDRPLRAVVYGRTSNPGSGGALPVRASRLELTADACDMPDALARADQPAVPAPGDEAWALDHPSIRSPHVIAHEDPAGTPREAMALMVDGEVHLARPTSSAGGGGGFALESAIGDPVFDATGLDWAADGVSDPALRFVGGALELWLTGWAGEVGTIARAGWDEGSGRFVFTEIVLDPAAVDGVDAFDGAAPFELSGVPYVAVRERREEGPRIAVYRVDGAPRRQAEVARPSGELFAFDRDEVAAPGVVVEGGVARVYYAGRRGTRWSIGLTVSSDAERWRAPLEGPVLTESGAGFDGIGVSEPSPVSVDGTLRLYYAGLDGARVRIGVATGP